MDLTSTNFQRSKSLLEEIERDLVITRQLNKELEELVEKMQRRSEEERVETEMEAKRTLSRQNIVTASIVLITIGAIVCAAMVRA